MDMTSWRGVVGIIKPTLRPGGLEEYIRLLPDGVSTIPLFLDIERGTVDEFRSVREAIEEKVRFLGGLGVSLIHPEGAPPFMVLGRAGERELIARWEREYGIPVFTAPTSQADAMRALGIRRLVGVTYFTGEINDIFARYFVDDGFEVLAMEGIDVPFTRVGALSSKEIYGFAKQACLRHPEADGLYMLGTGWRCLDIVQTLEQDLGIPVVHAVTARLWDTQRRLRIREPRTGYGRLLADLPPAR